MKINKAFMMAVICFFVQGINAATFTIFNYSGAPVEVTPRWNRGKEVAVKLENGKKSKKYDTNGHGVHSIIWKQNGRLYTVYLDEIKSGGMVEREFAILGNGNFQHTFVSFPKKFDNGQASVYPLL